MIGSAVLPANHATEHKGGGAALSYRSNDLRLAVNEALSDASDESIVRFDDAGRQIDHVIERGGHRVNNIKKAFQAASNR